jgi:hypothetical protein
MYTTARASGNIDKSKLNETEAARRVPLSVPNSFNDSFNSGIILLFIDLSPDYYNTPAKGFVFGVLFAITQHLCDNQ